MTAHLIPIGRPAAAPGDGVVLKAQIIPFVPRVGRNGVAAHLNPAPSRSVPRPDDLVMDHADTVPDPHPSAMPGRDSRNG